MYNFGHPDFPISSDRNLYFYEAYVRESTTTDDLGLYEVNLLNAGGQDTSLAMDPSFTVVRYGELCTRVLPVIMHYAPHCGDPLQVSIYFWTLPFTTVITDACMFRLMLTRLYLI